MNCRVDKNEHPDWWRHVPNSRPHAHHSSSMVVGLQSRASLSLRQDDNSIQNLVKLAQVEEPAIESQTLIPQSSHIRGVRGSRSSQENRWRCGNPLRDRAVVRNCISETASSVNFAQAVHQRRESLSTSPSWQCSLQSAEHANKCPSRVDCKEDVVCHHEPEEWLRLADRPWLVPSRPVVCVD